MDFDIPENPNTNQSLIDSDDLTTLNELIQNITSNITSTLCEHQEALRACMKEQCSFSCPSLQNLKEALDCLKKERYVLIKRSDMDRLATEVMQIKEFLPKVLRKDFMRSHFALAELDKELKICQSEKKKLEFDILQNKRKLDMLLTDIEHERKDNRQLRHQIAELNDANSQQSEFCTHMGAASCTLLWKMTQKESEALLTGQHIKDFLLLSSNTIESYTTFVLDEEADEKSDKSRMHFVLALCGVATNIAATASGREFLMANVEGRQFLNSLVKVLIDIPVKFNSCMKLRNLSLMCLFNTSINQKGIKFLVEKKGLICAIASIIESDYCADNRLHAIRLVQSLIIEPDCSQIFYHVVQLLPQDKLQRLIQTSRGEVRIALQELLADVTLVEREQ